MASGTGVPLEARETRETRKEQTNAIRVRSRGEAGNCSRLPRGLVG
jgi:hypothetical protein